MSLHEDKEIIKLERYLKKHAREELINQLRSLDNDALRQRLMKQAILEQEIMDTKSKEGDKDPVKSAKALVKEHNATYNEQKRMSQKISRFIHLLIEDSGKI